MATGGATESPHRPRRFGRASPPSDCSRAHCRRGSAPALSAATRQGRVRPAVDRFVACRLSSCLAMHDEVSEFFEPPGSLAEPRYCLEGKPELRLRHCVGPLEPVHRGEGNLALRDVLASGLAELLRRLLDVEDIVHDL